MLTASEYCLLAEFHMETVLEELHEVIERLNDLQRQQRAIRDGLGIKSHDRE